MAEVNGRLFLNNVSLGIYGDAVRQPAYRDAKARTLAQTAAQVLGPSAPQPAWSSWTTAAAPIATPPSCSCRTTPTRFDPPRAPGTRPALDSGQLGVLVLDRPAAGQSAGANMDGEAARGDRHGSRSRRHRRRARRARPAAPVRHPARHAPRQDLLKSRGRVAVGTAAVRAGPSSDSRNSKPAGLAAGGLRRAQAARVRTRGASPSSFPRARRSRHGFRPCASRALPAALRALRHRRRPPPPRARP